MIIMLIIANKEGPCGPCQIKHTHKQHTMINPTDIGQIDSM